MEPRAWGAPDTRLRVVDDGEPPAGVLKALAVPFPRDAVQQRQGGGGRSFDYVAAHTVIRRLNDAAGAWDWRIKSMDWRQMGGEALIVVEGELTIPGLGTRAGVGVQKVSDRGGEDLVKGASSDALKKAATLFGVAIDLYGPDFEADAERPSQPSQPPPRPQSRPSGPPPPPREPPTPTGAPTPPSRGGDGPMTDATRRRLFGDLARLGVGEDASRALARTLYGRASRGELTEGEADDLDRLVKGLAPVEAEWAGALALAADAGALDRAAAAIRENGGRRPELVRVYQARRRQCSLPAEGPPARAEPAGMPPPGRPDRVPAPARDSTA